MHVKSLEVLHVINLNSKHTSRHSLMVDSIGVPIRTKLSVPYFITAILFKSSNYDFWFSLALREFMVLKRWGFCLALAELFEVLLMAAAPRVVLLLFIIG